MREGGVREYTKKAVWGGKVKVPNHISNNSLYQLIYLICLLFRFEKLKPAVEKRKHKLQDSLHFFQFKFDVDEEVQWIKEKLPAAASTDYGKSLVDAQNLQKKHQVYFTSSF